MTLLVHAVGARPNFVKMAPVVEALDRTGRFTQLIVHTGQHYDARMSEEVLADLSFPEPNYFLGVGSGEHGEQTAKVLAAFERILLDVRPDAVVVAGDVNSTLACALAASKLGIDVVHLESGLRSGDWSMPEEVNRVLTDRLSDVLLTHSPEALDNLASEGIDTDRVHYVGNTMIDSLRRCEKTGARAGGLHRLRPSPVRLHPGHAPQAGERRRPHAAQPDRDGADRARRQLPGGLPGAPAHPREAPGQRRPRPSRTGRRPLHRAARLSRVPVAPGRRRRHPDRLGRRAGGGVRAGRLVLHVQAEHRAAGDRLARDERAARGRPIADLVRAALTVGADAVGDTALGRPCRTARGRGARRALREPLSSWRWVHERARRARS